MTALTTASNPELVAERAAAEIERHLSGAISERGVAHLALSGGTTPTRSYELLAGAELAWEAVEVWFADERCVDPDDEQSNFAMARRTLLDTVAVLDERLHRMEGELEPELAAERYAEALLQRPPTHNGLPVLDLIVLGIGPDGHIASLFPGAPTLAVEDKLCLGVRDSPKPPPQRITLSLPVLRSARRCLLLATGSSKADALSAALAQPSEHVPASLLRRERLTVIADDEACPVPFGR